ncbi:MAG: RES domain-containing protein [Verrucomicrobiae bacterium]|nr:RES domain-containing protein [Verrucomicrobiae bacterium]MCP5533770.1 RES domain-containing protein [Akkermansiaceae bacterium]MCP5544657.1 RES domain-containing protein [Akkermansiaceae bacterium]
MARYFRIVQARWAETAMDGEGARIHGGRWNPEGLAAVYLAESRALAMLEIVVHAPREILKLDWRIIEVTVPDALIEMVSELPSDWAELPSSRGARILGAAWLKRAGSPCLKLPSVVVPAEHTLLVNPRHPDFRNLEISAPQRFLFDARLGVSTVALHKS